LLEQQPRDVDLGLLADLIRHGSPDTLKLSPPTLELTIRSHRLRDERTNTFLFGRTHIAGSTPSVGVADDSDE
jgi:hypothetical protein